MSAGLIDIELACAWPDHQWVESLRVPEGTTLTGALALSRRLADAGGLPSGASVGVWSQVEVAPDARVLRPGDRVEIYRPLQADPKQARRERARAVRARQGV